MRVLRPTAPVPLLGASLELGLSRRIEILAKNRPGSPAADAAAALAAKVVGKVGVTMFDDFRAASTALVGA